MNLTGIFVSRTFNKDLSEKKVATSSPNGENKYGDDWWYDKVAGAWKPKNSSKVSVLAIPFNGPYRNIAEASDFTVLDNYYADREREDDDNDSPEEDFVKQHLRKWNKTNEGRPKRYTTAHSHNGYAELFPIDLDRVFDENSITVEDEIAMIETYHRGETYIDKNHNQINVVNRERNKVEFIRNPHIGKLKNDSITADRVAFLTMMGWQPGTITEESWK